MKNTLYKTMLIVISALILTFVLPGVSAKASDEVVCDTVHGSINYYRSQLNEKEQVIYDKLVELCDAALYDNKVEYVSLDGWEQRQALYDEYKQDGVRDRLINFALEYDHPEYCILQGMYLDAAGEMGVVAFSDEMYPLLYETILNEEYRNAMYEQIDAILERANAYVVPSYGDADYDVEEIYWMIYRICTEYSRNWVYNNNNTKRCHFANAAFLGEPVVCDGIHKGLQLLLNKCNIPCITICNRLHCWCLTKIADKWCSVDITEISRDTTFFGKKPLDLSRSIWYNTEEAVGEWAWTCPEISDMCMTELDSFGLNYCINSYYDCITHITYGERVSGRTAEDAMNTFLEKERTYGGVTDVMWICGDYTRLTSAPAANTVVIKNPSGKTEYKVGETFELYTDTNGVNDYIDWTASDASAFTFKFELGSKYHEKVTVTANKVGTYTISAPAIVGTGTDSIEITVVSDGSNGSGNTSPAGDTVTWAGGKKELKAIQLNTSIKATSWKDSKNKSKSGKLVWLVMSSETDISFNTEKHTVNTKSDGTKIASVSKGKVTAKKPGTVYVYAVDTGSFEYECFKVEIKQAAKKMVFVESAESTTKVKKLYVNVGETATAYFVADAGNDTVSSDCEYTVSADSKYSSNLETSGLVKAGDAYKFEITGKKANGNKVVNGKVTVVNAESGKKASISVVVMDSVKSITGGECAVSKKNDTCKINLNIVSADGDATTTDKLKVMVTTEEPTISGTKVTAAKGKEVSAKLVGNSIEVKATKDITSTQYICVIATNSATKTAAAYLVGTIQP